jgi:hypothetical protein
MSTRRRKMLSILAALFAVAAFFILSSIAVVWANGLKFNPETKRFEQTVVVAVDSDKNYPGALVYLNGELVATEVPFQLRGLVPGRYELLLEQLGYQPYYRVLHLAAGEAEVIEDYQPIAAKPLVTVDQDRIVFAEPAFEAGLRVTTDGELLDRTKLVSRFIGNPVMARRFNDGYVYQLGSELRLFLPDGPHDYLLYTLASSEVAKLNIRANAWEVILQEGETIKVIAVTEPSP